MKKRFFSSFIFIFLFTLFSSIFVFADTETIEGIITNVSQNSQTSEKVYSIYFFKPDGGKTSVDINSANVATTGNVDYKKGEKVQVTKSLDIEENAIYYLSGYVRRTSLYILFFIFFALTFFIAKKSGLMSILGMVASFLIIFKFLLPKILEGANPIFITLLASLFIIPITFYLSHGLNKKTTIAVIGTFISLVVTAIFAHIFINSAKLTGFSTEEAGFLNSIREGFFDMRGLLYAGIIIGALGVLDDVTISQASIVEQLKNANPELGILELYKSAMNVGRDHISSMVNTLVLVYAGASLPLLLIFVNNPHPFGEIINYEFLAEEIVRTLVGSIGLILAVPITTFIASIVAESNEPRRVRLSR